MFPPLVPRYVRFFPLGTAAVGLMLSACYSRPPTQGYTQRFEACMHQLERDRPEMTVPARRKSCTDEVGPPPFESPAAVPAPVY